MPGILTWDQVGERQYETGVDKGVLYVQDASGAYSKGVAWNGLISVTESPSGAEPTALWANNNKYLTLMSKEQLSFTIEAYMSPEEFDECDGAATIGGANSGVKIRQQKRKQFGFAYRTLIGNDTEQTAHGYMLHLVYGCLASPSEKAHSTVNEDPEAVTLSWEVSTTPVAVTGCEPTSCLEIDSTKIDADKLAAIEALLYGTQEADASLPLPNAIIEILEAAG